MLNDVKGVNNIASSLGSELGQTTSNNNAKGCKNYFTWGLSCFEYELVRQGENIYLHWDPRSEN